MESKTLTTILVILVCIFMFPFIIGLIGGFFGLIGSLFGGIGWLIGLIGGLIGSIFGFFGWLAGGVAGWHCWTLFGFSPVTVLVVGLIILLLVRRKR